MHLANSSQRTEWVGTLRSEPGFDVLRVARSRHVPIDVLVAPAEAARFERTLQQQRIPYQVFAHDVGRVLAKRREQQLLARSVLHGLAGRGPGLASLRYFPRYDEVSTYATIVSTISHSPKKIEPVFFRSSSSWRRW